MNGPIISAEEREIIAAIARIRLAQTKYAVTPLGVRVPVGFEDSPGMNTPDDLSTWTDLRAPLSTAKRGYRPQAYRDRSAYFAAYHVKNQAARNARNLQRYYLKAGRVGKVAMASYRTRRAAELATATVCPAIPLTGELAALVADQAADARSYRIGSTRLEFWDVYRLEPDSYPPRETHRARITSEPGWDERRQAA